MSHQPLSRRALLRGAAALSAAPLLPLAPASGRRAIPRLGRAQSARLSLVNPRLAHPVFAEPGGSFLVEVRAPASLDPRGWRLQLRSDLGATWDIPITDAWPTSIDYGRADGWRLQARPPAGLPPELFALSLSHSALGESVREERAVSIVPDLDADGYALLLTDEHVMYDSVDHYACDEPWSGYRSADLVRWATPVVNLLNPRLVLNAGDQAHQYATTGYRYAYNSDIYRCYLAAKAGYRVPSLMLLGNHEVHEKDAEQRARDWARWEGLAGRRAYHVRVGSLWVFAHDYLDPESRTLIERIYRQSFSEPGVAGRLLVQHHTSAHGYRPGQEQAPTLMLIGHYHRQSVEDSWPYPILMGAAAHRYATASVVRLERREGRWRSDAAGRWGACDVRLVGDYGSPSASASYAQPNDGRARSNVVAVRNRLSQRFEDGRVQLVLAEGRYQVRGGDLLAQYPAPGGRSVALVRVDIPADGELRLEVTAQSSSTFIMSTDTPETEATDEPAVVLNEAGAPLLPPGPADQGDGVRAPEDPDAAADGPSDAPFQVALPLL